VLQFFNRCPVLSRLSAEGCASHIIRNVLWYLLFAFLYERKEKVAKRKETGLPEVVRFCNRYLGVAAQTISHAAYFRISVFLAL